LREFFWGSAETVFRLIVVVLSFIHALGRLNLAFGRQAALFLRRPFSGPRNEVFHGRNPVSKAIATTWRDVRKFVDRVSIRLSEPFRREEMASGGSLRLSWPRTMRKWSGRTLILTIDDKSVAFCLANEDGNTSFISSHAQASWSEILLPLERLIDEVEATEIVFLCSHHPHGSLPIQSIRGVLHHHPDDLLYLPPASKNDRFDRWLVDGEGRLTQLAEPRAWWNVLVDRQSNVAPGFPVAMSRDTLRFASDYLTKMAPDSASIVRLALWLQQSGRAIWELRESSTITTDGDPSNCPREYPEFAASLAQTLRSEFPHVINPLRTHEKIVEPARRLSTMESKHRRPRATGEDRPPLKVLYLSPVATHPTNHGNRKTMVSFGEIFKDAGLDILFASPMDWDTTPHDVRIMEEFWGSVETLPPSDQPIGPYGADFDSWITPEVCSLVRYLCIRNEIDVVFCSYVWYSAVLDFVPGYITKILDTHDMFSDRFAMLESRGLPKEFFSCTPEEEGRYLSRADVVVARRSEEAEYFQSLVPRRPVEVVTHIERPKSVPAPPDGTKLRFGFLASRNQVNAAILTEFLNAIIAFEGQLDFDLVIAGQVTDLVPSTLFREVSNILDGRVQTLGFVETLEDFYSQVHCMVSPVSLGTGVNVKTLEALSFGMPILSTKHGSKGTGSTLPEHNFVGVEALIMAMTRLSLPDLQRLREHSLKIAEGLWLDNSRRLLALVTVDPSKKEYGK
jgi:hypothetical protein